MKKLILSIALLCFCFSAFAQVDFGLRAGLNSNRLIASQSGWKAEDLRIGFAGGAFLRLKSNHFYLQPELIFSQKGGNLKPKDELGNVSEIKRSINSLDVPIMVGASFLKDIFRANLGPVISFPINAKQDGGDNSGDYQKSLKGATVGYQVGLGADIGRLTLDFRYEGNLSKMGDSLPGGFKVDDRVSTFQLTAGFKIF